MAGEMNNVEVVENSSAVENVSNENVSKGFYSDKVFLIAFGISALIIPFALLGVSRFLFGGVISIALFTVAFAFVLSYSIKHSFSKSVRVSLLSTVSIIILLFLTFGLSDIGDYLFFYVPFLLLELVIGMSLVLLIGFGIRKLLKIEIAGKVSTSSTGVPVEGGKFSRVKGNWKYYILSFVYFWILSLAVSTFRRFWWDPFQFGDFMFKYSGATRLIFNPALVIAAIVIVVVVYFSFLKGVIAGAIPIVLLSLYLIFFTSGETQGYGLLGIGIYSFYLICLAGLGAFVRVFYNLKNNVLKIFFFGLPFVILLIGSTWFVQGMYNPTEFYCGTILTSDSECYSHLAESTGDSDFCDNIGDSQRKYNCQIESVASGSGSCLDLNFNNQRIDCYKKRGTVPKAEDYPNLCGYHGGDNSCYEKWAVFLEDELICDYITENFKKFLCFKEVAYSFGNSTICDNLEGLRTGHEEAGTDLRDRCLRDFSQGI